LRYLSKERYNQSSEREASPERTESFAHRLCR
jgi:hypothetical protein